VVSVRRRSYIIESPLKRKNPEVTRSMVIPGVYSIIGMYPYFLGCRGFIGFRGCTKCLSLTAENTDGGIPLRYKSPLVIEKVSLGKGVTGLVGLDQATSSANR